MTPDAPGVPHSRPGFLQADLQRFVEAARQRAATIELAIADADARRAKAEIAASTAAKSRDGIADLWLSAQRDADTVRAEAEARAAEIIEAAEQEARTIRARARLTRAMPGAPSVAVGDATGDGVAAP